MSYWGYFTHGNLTLDQAATDQIIKNLQRENAMISTAWYDLTSRLQSNHVVLQRRQDMPKSWLNKQRQMVNGKFGPFFTDSPPFFKSGLTLVLATQQHQEDRSFKVCRYT